jgi:hypothetical protein
MDNKSELTHEDDFILSYVHNIVIETKRLNGLNMEITSEDAKNIDKYACIITAYLNGIKTILGEN